MFFVVYLKVVKFYYCVVVLICRLFWNMINVMYKVEILYFRFLYKKVLDRFEYFFVFFFLEMFNNQGCIVVEFVDNKVKVV